MINDYLEGGLKIIDVTSFNKSLKATWIKEYQDNENCNKWKVLFNLELGNSEGKTVIQGNLNKKDINTLKIEYPFVKEIM